MSYDFDDFFSDYCSGEFLEVSTDLMYYDFEDYNHRPDHDSHVVAARTNFMVSDHGAHVDDYWAESIPF